MQATAPEVLKRNGGEAGTPIGRLDARGEDAYWEIRPVFMRRELVALVLPIECIHDAPGWREDLKCPPEELRQLVDVGITQLL